MSTDLKVIAAKSCRMVVIFVLLFVTRTFSRSCISWYPFFQVAMLLI